MGVDRTGAGADDPTEATEEPPPPDRRPPADRPGTEGAPSRADSRNGAAAANETGNQTAEQQREEKTDSAQAPQENTDRVNDTTVEDKPETPGTLERAGNDDDPGERPDSNPGQEVASGREDTAPPSDGASEPTNAEHRDQASNGQAVPHDATTPSETDRQTTPAAAAERTEDKDAGETPATDSTSEAVPSPVDLGDRPDSIPKQAQDALVSVPDTHDVPRDSPEAPDDGHDAAQESPRPNAENAEPAARPPEAEDQSGATEKPQTGPPEQALPTADVNTSADRDADNASDRPQEENAAPEPTEDRGSAPPESTEAPGQRPERRNETQQEVEAVPDAEGPGIADKRDIGDRLMVQGIPVHEYLDPVGAAAWSSDIGDQPVDPDDRKGDRIAKSETDEISRIEKLRRKFHREGTDAVEDAGKAASHVKDILARPPTGHMETRTAPTAAPAQHDGAGITDTFTAVVGAAVMIGEASRLVHKKYVQKKGYDDDRDR